MFDLISNFEFERDLNQSEFSNNNSGDVASLVEGYCSLITRASHIVTELDPTGFHEVPTDFHAPVHLPAHAPARALTRTPVPVPMHLPAQAPGCALTCAPVPVPVHRNVFAAPLTAYVPARVPVPPSVAWMTAV